MSQLAHSNEIKPKKKARGRPITGKNDPRRNNAGAPKRGLAWGDIIAKYGNMTGPQLSKEYDTLAKEFSKLPTKVKLKELVVIAAYASLMNDFSSSLWTAMMDRSDGKPAQSMELPEDLEGFALVIKRHAKN